MHQPQPFKKKRKCSTDQDRYWRQARKSIIVKDLPIHDLRSNLDYITELDEPVLCKEIPVNGYRSSADILGKVIFKVLMSYSEVSQLSFTSHPLQNIILKPGNYLEGPKPGILKKMSEHYMLPNDFGIYNIYIPEEKTLEDINTVQMINWLWVNKRHNYDAWMKIISAMVFAHCQMLGGSIENDITKKCFLTRVSVNALIGHRGICHGLGDLKVPKLKINQSTGVYSWPAGWALHLDTDDNSSFHSSSPENSDFDTDSVDSGPIGVAYNRPRITGFTSFTETSSESSNEDSSKVKTSRLDLFIDGHSGDYWDRRMHKRFDLYVRTSFNERRNRGAIREARRKVRLQYDRERRTMESVFNAEAKRAEALAAERVRAEIRNREAKQQINNISRPRKKSIEHYLYRYKQLNHKLKSQLEYSWRRYYGEKCIPKYLNNSEHINDISLKCWLSPVPWIEQTGINGGFAAIAMALQRTRLIEVILGEMEGRHSNEPRRLLQQLPKGADYFKNKNKMFDRFGVNSSSELNKEIVSYLISNMKDSNISNWGEVFSGEMLAFAAKFASTIDKRYEVNFVRSDLLANYKNDLRPDASEAEKTIRDNSLSIVQRLVRGQLIAVCYDADEKKRPTINGGRTAHWTLLCGVIVGFPSKQSSMKPSFTEKIKSTDIPHKDKELAYVYHFEPEIHLLTPKGFISRETGEPVNIEMIKKQAVHVTEEPNGNGDMHGQNCKKRCKKCQKCLIEYVDKKLDLERDADSVWVVAKHRDEYMVWTLRELASSNRQLRTPGREIMNTIPLHQKLDLLLREIATGQEVPGESVNFTFSTQRQRIREQLDVKRRENRALCTVVANQMELLSNKYPDLLPSELVELLDLSTYTSDLVGVWKSAARVAYETPVNFPWTEPIRPKMPMVKEPTHQIPVAPPPTPIPTSPTPVTPPTYSLPNRRCPYIFHNGSNLETNLARQYVCFEPIEHQYKNNGMDDIPNVNDINDNVVRPVQFYFSMNGKLANWIQKVQQFQRAAAKNRASTSATFTG